MNESAVRQYPDYIIPLNGHVGRLNLSGIAITLLSPPHCLICEVDEYTTWQWLYFVFFLIFAIFVLSVVFYLPYLLFVLYFCRIHVWFRFPCNYYPRTASSCTATPSKLHSSSVWEVCIPSRWSPSSPAAAIVQPSQWALVPHISAGWLPWQCWWQWCQWHQPWWALSGQ